MAAIYTMVVMIARSDTPTVLAFVRHGQSEGNLGGRIGGHSATPLTELGRRQAAATAEHLAADFQPTVVVSSDLPRAVQTATPIAAAAGLDIGSDPRLRERSLGILDGLSFTQIEERYPDMWRRLRARDPHACPPGGETIDAVFDRISRAVADIASTYAGERVVLVSHGLAIYHALAHIFGLGSPAAGLKVFALVDNCSISTFTRRRDLWLVGAINDRAHLVNLALK